jgi:hypothetical protein
MPRGARLLLIASLLAGTPAALAACSEPESGPGIATAASGRPAPRPTASRDLMQEQRDWARCMRERGVDMPDPDPNQRKIIGFEYPAKGTAAADAYARAEAACEPFNTFMEYEPDPLTEEQLALWREWARCMRDNGVDQPDPGVYGFEPDTEGRRDPAVEALWGKAEEACFDKMLAARQVAVP